jgi:hypothetical protein
MKMFQLPTTIAIIVGIALAQIAFAVDAPTFDEVDADKDGAISATEAAEVPALDFAAADTDKDGTLSRSEYEAALS